MKTFKRETLTGQPSDMVEETSAIHLRFSAKNGLKSLVCFIALVVIALYVRDSFIRPTFGDVLVVVWLGIESSSPLAVILGATFDWKDLLAYCIGGLLCWWMEKK